MSELQELLSRRLQHEPRDSTQYRVTVRLGSDLHRRLVHLAAAFGMSKTATCEDITAAAINDSWTLYLESLDDDERHDLLLEIRQEEEQEEIEMSAPPGFFEPALRSGDEQ